MNNPFAIVRKFERKIGQYTGSPRTIAVDCCSSAIFLAAKYSNLIYGTDTIISFSVELSMFASNPPKKTLFSKVLEIKLLPLIVIALPIPPNAGSIKSTLG